MKKHFKANLWLRIISAILAIVVAGLLISQRNSDCHDFECNGIYYRIVDDISDIVKVTYKGKDWESYDHEYSGTVVIPDSLTYRNRTYRVTEIDDYAFSGCSEMTSVSIPASVWYIGREAFSGCEALKEIHISNLSAWCEMSFYDVLDDAGDTPLHYASELYLDGELITDLVVPEDVTEIGAHAFEGYEKLKSVVLHNSIYAIHKSAFLNCTHITDINFPDSLFYIGPYAFNGTAWYENKPDGEVYIGKLLYKYKGEMPHNSNIVVKDGTETICESAFDGCTGLTSITLPSSLKHIHNYAFAGCDNLIEIYCKAQTPPCYNRYYNDYHRDAKLYIPKGTLETYKNDSFIGGDNAIETDFLD